MSPTAKQVIKQYHKSVIDMGSLIQKTELSPQDIDGLKALITLDIAADELFWHQISSYGFKLYQALNDIKDNAPDGFEDYLFALRINHGFHDEVTKEKFFPDFTKESFQHHIDNVITHAKEQGDWDTAARYHEYTEDFHENLSITTLIFSDFQSTRPIGCNLYPKTVTTPDEFIPLTDPYSVIREEDSVSHSDSRVTRRTRSLFEVPYRQEYREVIKKLIPMYDKAINAYQHRPRFAAYLEASRDVLADPTKTRPRNLPWVSIWIERNRTNPIIDHVADFIESYLAFGIRKLWQSDLLVQTRTSAVLNNMVKDISPYESMLPYTPSRRDQVPIPSIRFMDILFRSGFSAHSSQGIANSLPNDSWIKDTIGAVNTMYTNIIAAKQDAILTPLIADLVPESILRGFDPDFAYQEYRGGRTISSDKLRLYTQLMFILGTAAHEATHFLGRKPSHKKLSNELGSDATMWEEGRAESGKLFYYRAFITEGIQRMQCPLDPDRAVRFAYSTTIADLVRHLRLGKDNAYGRTARIRLAFLIDTGALRLTDSEQFIADPQKMEEASRALFEAHLRIITDCDTHLASRLIRLESRNTDLIDRIVSRTSYLPRDIILEYT